MLEKEFHIFISGAFYVEQILLREYILMETNFCEDSDFKYFAEIKSQEFLKLKILQIFFAEMSKIREIREICFP